MACGYVKKVNDLLKTLQSSILCLPSKFITMTNNNKTLSIYDDLQLPLGSVRSRYLVKFVDPSKEYDVDYLAPHQSKGGNREEGIFTLKGEDLTEKQILQLFLREAL